LHVLRSFSPLRAHVVCHSDDDEENDDNNDNDDNITLDVDVAATVCLACTCSHYWDGHASGPASGEPLFFCRMAPTSLSMKQAAFFSSL
jgi:hypothetical protein